MGRTHNPIKLYKMKTLKLNQDENIPVIGLGTWMLTGQQCIDTVTKALDLGYSHIDTALVYENQPQIGAALKHFDRSNIFITSKIFNEDLHYEDVIKAANRILNELQINYLNLLLIHWPNKNVPISETLEAFKTLSEKGLIRACGVSNFTSLHIEDAIATKKVAITNNQVEFHPYLYQKNLLNYCLAKNIILTAYSPLLRSKILKDQVINKIAKKYNKTVAQVTLCWMAQKGIVVIPKASSAEHLTENLFCLDWELDLEDTQRIDRLNKNYRKINPPWAEFDYSGFQK